MSNDFRHGRPWGRVRAKVLAGQPQYCYLCRGAKGPILYTVKWPHPLSAVVDHVLPLKYFAHLPDSERRAATMDMANLKPAHKTCNESKQDDLPPVGALQCNPGTTDWFSNDR